LLAKLVVRFGIPQMMKSWSSWRRRALIGPSSNSQKLTRPSFIVHQAARMTLISLSKQELSRMASDEIDLISSPQTS
jgi:hypothetical protein